MQGKRCQHKDPVTNEFGRRVQGPDGKDQMRGCGNPAKYQCDNHLAANKGTRYMCSSHAFLTGLPGTETETHACSDCQNDRWFGGMDAPTKGPTEKKPDQRSKWKHDPLQHNSPKSDFYTTAGKKKDFTGKVEDVIEEMDSAELGMIDKVLGLARQEIPVAMEMIVKKSK